MAVSFKVPASPKRDIFNIDNFLGVDLTNTGANVDEVRSPNAENMVRYVPGKVRKRTGYHTQVEFSSRKDVNRVLGTSNEYVEITVTGTDYATADVLYNFAEDIDSPDVYFEAEAKGEYRVGIEKENAGLTTWTITDGESINFTYNQLSAQKGLRILVYRVSSGADDYIKIKNFRACSHSDTSATTVNEWKAIEWSAAPEDNGIIFKREETTPTIWGVHKLRTGVFDGNRVVDVNRALSTSDSFVSYSVPARGTSINIYDIGNPVYRDSDTRTEVYVEFDYISDADVIVWIADWGFTSNTWIQNTNGNVAHFSGKNLCGTFNSYPRIRLEGKTTAANVQIKNFSLLYEKSDSYQYKPAPEDSGDTFPTGDLFNVKSENLATIDDYTITETGSTVYENVMIADSGASGVHYFKISFNLYITSTSTQGFTICPAYRSGGSSSYNASWAKTFPTNVANQSVEFYVSTSDYINALIIDEIGSTYTGDTTIRLSEIKVQEIVGKKSYDISSKNYVYHAGSKFYLRAGNSKKLVEIYNNASQHLSQSWQLNEKLFILDGKHIYSYSMGDSDVEVLGEGSGYIPLVTISKLPSGGGISYDPLNMLQPGFYEQFVVNDNADATAVNFYLSFGDLDETPVKAWLLDANANWNLKTEGTDFTVDRANGIVKFNTAPGLTPIRGEDNVKILAYRTVPGYADRVSKCTIGTLFGVGGAADRLFLSGNPDYPNWDFYSQQYDPTYFPDTGYSSLGSAASAIVGYAIINNYLATFKDDFDSSQAVFIREGDLVVKEVEGREVSEPAFKLINTLQGNGVVAPYSFGYLQTEPLFLTRSGVYAITAQDITGEKYSQNRSFYLNGYLTKEENLQNAVATVFNDMYVLAINNKFYILDGLQATRTDRAEPYATRQYVGFYCTNIPAVSMWTDEQALWIGTNDGRVCRFATDIEALDSYNDDGAPIYCCWETPDLDGKLFYKNKTFRYFAVRMMKALRTSVAIWSQKKGNWVTEPIKEDRISGVVFDFENIDFENFSFSTDRSEKVVHTKIRVKKVDKARFRVDNGYVNEPFGLFDLALEYIERGNYKG